MVKRHDFFKNNLLLTDDTNYSANLYAETSYIDSSKKVTISLKMKRIITTFLGMFGIVSLTFSENSNDRIKCNYIETVGLFWSRKKAWRQTIPMLK